MKRVLSLEWCASSSAKATAVADNNNIITHFIIIVIDNYDLHLLTFEVGPRGKEKTLSLIEESKDHHVYRT